MLDTRMTKFPGGGLKLGEGPEDCIKREAKEELGQDIEIINHFYTTGFFQQARFFESHQLISIYYLIKLKDDPAFKISEKAFDFPENVNGKQSFRWADLKKIEEEELTFPVDRYVIGLLKKDIKGFSTIIGSL